MTKPSLPILHGTVAFLALAAIAKAGRMHGFEVLRWIEERSEGSLLLEEGALYPALHRLEKRGWLEADWGVSEKGRRAKYYSLTQSGRQAFDDENRGWKEYVQAVEMVVAEGGSP